MQHKERDQEMLRKKRLARILFLPIIVLAYTAGWLLAQTTEQKAKQAKIKQTRTRVQSYLVFIPEQGIAVPVKAKSNHSTPISIKMKNFFSLSSN